jgi:ABC-type branched-subunit amino acid transport system ATPase component
MTDRRLATSDLARHFIGLRALDGVSVEVRPREIVALIGPNGSGKTTLLNVVAGALRPTRGTVEIDGTVTSGWPAHRVAAHGVARTFQSIRLFTHLPVIENVAVGVTARRNPGRRRDIRVAARAILEFLELDHLHDRLAGTLPYGDQRRVELARALASDPHYLLLDEPAAGMNEAEVDLLLATLRRIRDTFEPGILVIDHDLRLIMRLSERIYVLNEGKLIATGTPTAVRSEPAVIKAYLGSAGSGAPTPDQPATGSQ